ncbi:MAG: hypothetical protein U0704_07625 [Candidatus Eisenbacteria bacterium]
MHLLDAWTALSVADLARLLGIPLAIIVATLLPGRRPSGVAALVIAVAVALCVELADGWRVRAAWTAAWLAVAWFAGARGLDGPRPRTRRRGGFEAGVVALPLGGALALLLLAAVSRQSSTLAPLDARRASLGVLVLGAGLLHLMMRRHARRATLAFASLGLGLELLATAARRADVTGAGAPAGAALAATLVAVALVARIAGARERFADSPLVSDAHELHD